MVREDFITAQGRWHVTNIRPGKTVYARRQKRASRTTTLNIFMHRLLLPDAEQVDHINGNGLDNRRCNLRAATPGQNMANRPRRRDNRTGFKGVHRSGPGFSAQIKSKGVRTYLGYYKTADAAARAYDWAALQIHGPFARTNFPRERYLNSLGFLTLTAPRWAQIGVPA